MQSRWEYYESEFESWREMDASARPAIMPLGLAMCVISDIALQVEVFVLRWIAPADDRIMSKESTWPRRLLEFVKADPHGLLKMHKSKVLS
jgi:hypothetical protein